MWVLLIWKPHRSVGGEGLKRKKDWGVLTLWTVFHLTYFQYNTPIFQYSWYPSGQILSFVPSQENQSPIFCGVSEIHLLSSYYSESWKTEEDSRFFLTYNPYLYSHFQRYLLTPIFHLLEVMWSKLDHLTLTVLPTLGAEDAASLLKCHHWSFYFPTFQILLISSPVSFSLSPSISFQLSLGKEWGNTLSSLTKTNFIAYY